MSKDDFLFLHPIDQHYNSQENFFNEKLDKSFDSYNSEDTELSIKMDNLKNTYNDLFECDNYSPIKNTESKDSKSKFYKPPKQNKFKLTSKLKDGLSMRIEIHKYKANLKKNFYITLMVMNYKCIAMMKDMGSNNMSHSGINKCVIDGTNYHN
jgi:hypothetical protein